MHQEIPCHTFHKSLGNGNNRHDLWEIECFLMFWCKHCRISLPHCRTLNAFAQYDPKGGMEKTKLKVCLATELLCTDGKISDHIFIFVSSSQNYRKNCPHSKYSCNKVTKTWIQISRQNWNWFFLKYYPLEDDLTKSNSFEIKK